MMTHALVGGRRCAFFAALAIAVFCTILTGQEARRVAAAGVPAAGASASPAAHVGDTDWQARLAEIRVQLAIDREFDEANGALGELMVQMLRATEAQDQVLALSEILLAQAESLVEQDSLGAALDLLSTELNFSTLDVHPQKAEEIWAAVQRQPKVLALAAVLDKQAATDEQAPAADIAAAVAEALAAGDGRLIRNLGSRAVPALVSQIDPQGLSFEWDSEPLQYLAELDPQRFLSLSRKLLEGGDFANPGRVGNPLQVLLRDRRDEYWFSSAGRRPQLISDDARELLILLLEQEGSLAENGSTVPAFRPTLGELSYFGGIPPEVSEAIASSLLQRPEMDALLFLRELKTGPGSSVPLTPLYEALLAHPSDVIRAEVAEKLAGYPGNSALRGNVTDVDPRVRAALARSLSTHVVKVVAWGAGFRVSYSDEIFVATRAEEERVLLTRLARDSDAAVRLAAIDAVLSVEDGEPLEADIYRRLARDSDLRVRTALVSLVHSDLSLLAEVMKTLSRDDDPLIRIAVAERADLPHELRADVLTDLCADVDAAVREKATAALCASGDLQVSEELYLALSRDEDPLVRAQLADVELTDIPLQMRLLQTLAKSREGVVLEAVDARLSKDLRKVGFGLRAANAYADLLEQRLLHPTVPWSGSISSLEAAFFTTPEVFLRLTRWSLERGGERLWEGLLYFANHSTHRMDAAATDWLSLTNEELRLLMNELVLRESRGGLGLLVALVERLAEQGETYEALLQQVSRDPKFSPEVRWTARTGLLHLPGTPDALLAELLHRDFEALPWEDSENYGLLVFVSALSETSRAEFTLALVQTEQLSDSLLELILRAGFPSEAVLRAVLDRYAGRDQSALLAQAIRATPEYPALIDFEWLVGLTTGPYRWEALSALRQSRTLKSLSVFRDRLADYKELGDGWRSDGSTLTGIWMHEFLVNSVVGYLSNEAADILLNAAAVASTKDERDLCLAGVQTIQQYQDAKQDWERRLSAGNRREDTVRELATMLDSSSSVVRVQALRALATLGAVDQMPAIIRLLSSDDEAVSEAARGALAQLNREEPATENNSDG